MAVSSSVSLVLSYVFFLCICAGRVNQVQLQNQCAAMNTGIRLHDPEVGLLYRVYALLLLSVHRFMRGEPPLNWQHRQVSWLRKI